MTKRSGKFHSQSLLCDYGALEVRKVDEPIDPDLVPYQHRNFDALLWHYCASFPGLPVAKKGFYGGPSLLSRSRQHRGGSYARCLQLSFEPFLFGNRHRFGYTDTRWETATYFCFLLLMPCSACCMTCATSLPSVLRVRRCRNVPKILFSFVRLIAWGPHTTVSGTVIRSSGRHWTLRPQDIWPGPRCRMIPAPRLAASGEATWNGTQSSCRKSLIAHERPTVLHPGEQGRARCMQRAMNAWQVFLCFEHCRLPPGTGGVDPCAWPFKGSRTWPEDRSNTLVRREHVTTPGWHTFTRGWPLSCEAASTE